MTEVDAVREAEFEQQLKEIVLRAAADMPCDIFLFGSRAQKSIRRSSDFDVGIKGLTARDFYLIKERIEDAVEESNIPHGVDVVDFDQATEPFRSMAQETRIIWKRA
jgi:predicted nucleotidyltransferase